MNQKIRTTSRNLHRDIAYLFLGLIISFSISGIALNHRRNFNPREYVYTSEEVKFNLPSDESEITEDLVKDLLTKHAVQEAFRTFRIQEGKLRVFVENGLIEASLETGEGKIERTKKRPVLAEMTLLHQTTNEWWIWYSDIFGVAMILIALSGTFISSGKFSFAQRGWKLTLVGVIFPLVFLFLLS